MNNKETNGTKIVVLGGLGEVGKNMYCIMHNDAIVIIDAGVRFPDSEIMGVDYILPDFTFLKENEEDTSYISEDIKEALKSLTIADRALVFSRVIEEKSYSELEYIYGVSATTLRKRYERAKKKLAKALMDTNSYYERLGVTK